MSKVLQAKLKAQEASDGQFKFSTLQMGMPVPYRIYYSSGWLSILNHLPAQSIYGQMRFVQFATKPHFL